MPGGPSPLRGVDGKQLKVYPAGPCKGQPLSPADVELVRAHTLVAIRVAKVLAALHVRGLPFIYETPEEAPNQVSMLHLEEYVRLLALPGVKHVVGVQCTFEADSAKPTSWCTSWPT